MWSTWTAGGAVTLTWSGPNHCRGLLHTPQSARTSMCNITHMHAHTHDPRTQWCRGGMWLAGQRTCLRDTWHTNAPLNQPQCLLLKWGVVDHGPADTSAVWFLSDLWRPTCGRLKLIGSLSWVILWCVYILRTGKPVEVPKAKSPLSFQGFNKDPQRGLV